MMGRVIGISLMAAAGVFAAGCAGVGDRELAVRTGGAAGLFNQFAAYDGEGRALSFAQVVERCEEADVVLFGEQHSNVVCNLLEAQLLHALANGSRPMTLAMEFFEADTQAALDAYLEGRMDEAAFVEQTRQKRAYVLAHRPLIEYCRAAGLPVAAANVPRRFLRAFSKSGVDFDTFRREASAEDRRWLPRKLGYVSGAYRERFMEIMKSHPAPPSATQPVSQPTSSPASPALAGKPPVAPGATSALADKPPVAPGAPASGPASQPTAEERAERGYLTQLLWDNAMSESVANHRRRHGSRRVMLVIGSFHVSREGGTYVRLRAQRPDDRVCTIVFEARIGGGLEFDEADAGKGDVIIYGVTPPPAPQPLRATPTSSPASQLASQPASQPASGASP